MKASMPQSDNILQELRELNSTLANNPAQPLFSAPADYFEELPGVIMGLIKTQSLSAPEETVFLSVTLGKVSKTLPFEVPSGYFNGLQDKIMEGIRETADYQSSQEELTVLSPLLRNITKKVPYSVPPGYFENLGTKITAGATTPTEAKVISMAKRHNWLRYAAAAVITGLVALSGILYFTQNKQIDPVKEPQAWVQKNVKKVSTDEINSFIKLTEDESATKGSIALNTNKPDEIKELMQDVSDNEIQKFLTETRDVEETSDEDLLIN